jgi:hypothetical protein
MDVKGPEPTYETVIDLDLYFLGGTMQGLTLFPEKGDRLTAYAEALEISFKSTNPEERIIVERRNLLWSAERTRQKLMPVKKFEPSEKSATATT